MRVSSEKRCASLETPKLAGILYTLEPGPEDWGPEDPRTQNLGPEDPRTWDPRTRGPGTQGPRFLRAVLHCIHTAKTNWLF